MPLVRISIAIALLGALAFGIASIARRDDEPRRPSGVRTVAVWVQMPGPARIMQSLEFTGDILPMRETWIHSRVQGWVAALHADLGDILSKGALLALIDTTELALARQQAATRLAKARGDLQRLQGLAERQMAATKMSAMP